MAENVQTGYLLTSVLEHHGFESDGVLVHEINERYEDYLNVLIEDAFVCQYGVCYQQIDIPHAIGYDLLIVKQLR